MGSINVNLRLLKAVDFVGDVDVDVDVVVVGVIVHILLVVVNKC